MALGEMVRVYLDLTCARSLGEWRAPVGDPRVVSDFETDVLETFPAACKSYQR